MLPTLAQDKVLLRFALIAKSEQSIDAPPCTKMCKHVLFSVYFSRILLVITKTKSNSTQAVPSTRIVEEGEAKYILHRSVQADNEIGFLCYAVACICTEEFPFWRVG